MFVFKASNLNSTWTITEILRCRPVLQLNRYLYDECNVSMTKYNIYNSKPTSTNL